MGEFLSDAPLAGPRRQGIGNQPAVAGIVPEIGARRRVILHTADDLFSLGDTRDIKVIGQSSVDGYHFVES
jgi:hypothetical protein